MILSMPKPGENLDRLLKDQGRSVTWLAKRLGVASKQSVFDWIQGATPRDENTWGRIADVLGVPLSELVDEDKQLGNVTITGPYKPSDHPQINLVPYWGTVPCGEWEAPVADPELIQVSDRITDTEGVIAVRISGESLAPRFHDRQVVAVKLSPVLKDGVVTLFQNQDGELTLKVLRYTPEGWQLHSINPAYGIVSADKVTILGHAISAEEFDSLGLRP